ncbi:hypothetical protein SAMN05421594_1686 [Chryseobacterium oleae]|uniref:Uncharacterized protein n=1 Tax=Chryseobacterium oleae TaxID=491207 RepID=A0A1I4XBC8_CHROL|nr:hypothetical protein SAMN05421594_1686 [Chryseobacterium oleae]
MKIVRLSERVRIRTFDRPDYKIGMLYLGLFLLGYYKTKRLTIKIVSLFK